MSANEVAANPSLFVPGSIKTVFIESVRQALANLDNESTMTVKSKLIEIIGGWNPLYVLSRDFIIDVSDRVFEHELFRDWLLNARFVFFMNMASHAGESMVSFILDNLARNASFDLGCSEYLEDDQAEILESISVSPVQISQELLTYREAKTMIAANSWLMVIMLALAYIPLDHEVLSTPKTQG